MGISSKPLARLALRASVGWVSRANWGSRTRTLALIGVSRYDSGDMRDSDSKPDIASVPALAVSQPICLQFVTIENP